MVLHIQLKKIRMQKGVVAYSNSVLYCDVQESTIWYISWYTNSYIMLYICQHCILFWFK